MHDIRTVRSSPFYVNPVVKEKRPMFKPHAKFSPCDDDRLRHIVEVLGDEDWNLIAQYMQYRNPRQCRERWQNYLCPSLNRSPWTDEEDRLLLQKQKELGSRWVQIATFFRNRTDAMVKNRFHVLKRRESKHRHSKQLQPPQATTESAFIESDDYDLEMDSIMSEHFLELVMDTDDVSIEP